MLHNSLRFSRFETLDRSFPGRYVWSVKLISSKSIAVRWPDLPLGIKSGISARVGDQLFVGLGTATIFMGSTLLAPRLAGRSVRPFRERELQALHAPA